MMSRPVFGSVDPLATSTTHLRTECAAIAIAAGIHPLTKRPLLPAARGLRCTDCHHQYDVLMANTYHKCELVEATGGPGTDVRMKWPACDGFEPRHVPGAKQ